MALDAGSSITASGGDVQILSISFACLSYVLRSSISTWRGTVQPTTPMPSNKYLGIPTPPSLLARKTSSEPHSNGAGRESPSVPDIISNIFVAEDL